MTDDRPEATLGVVSGRRRQGKTYLLRALAQTTGGFFFEAVQGTEAESLRMLGVELAAYLGSPKHRCHSVAGTKQSPPCSPSAMIGRVR